MEIELRQVGDRVDDSEILLTLVKKIMKEMTSSNDHFI